MQNTFQERAFYAFLVLGTVMMLAWNSYRDNQSGDMVYDSLKTQFDSTVQPEIRELNSDHPYVVLLIPRNTNTRRRLPNGRELSSAELTHLQSYMPILVGSVKAAPMEYLPKSGSTSSQAIATRKIRSMRNDAWIIMDCTYQRSWDGEYKTIDGSILARGNGFLAQNRHSIPIPADMTSPTD